MPREQSGDLPARRPAPAPRAAPRLVVLLLAACAPDSAPPVREEGAGTVVPEAGPALPDTVRDTLVPEGTPGPVTLRRFRSPDGFPLPFHIYLPPDLRVAPSGTPVGEGVRFVARFGGVPREDIEGRSRGAAGHARGGSGAAPGEGGGRAPRLAWPRPRDGVPVGAGAPPLSRARGDGVRGAGWHAGRVTHFPPEAADGMGPRVARVLERWRWADTRLGLDG